ncbi:hypothetical protein BX600DRAFT_428851 [Xylariales sp. PMI_506]|nr:hypothetical protein BX600DRAFT_428851 [Xylariales sp. PMI_506]
MQAVFHPGEQTRDSLGQRRGLFDLARFGGSLTWASTETECLHGTRAYPSPPMSGSPQSSSKPIQEAGDRGQGAFPITAQDVYRPSTTLPGTVDARGAPSQSLSLPLPPTASGGGRPFHVGTVERSPYPYTRAGDAMSRTLPFTSQPSPLIPQHTPYALPPVGETLAAGSAYTIPARPPTSESNPYTSPKSQRKTKGHVASACVPCKKAHLRCDAQRPCSRCMSNGKEESCVDVQHKKRGRPRLRDDRETRFDPPRFQHAVDPNMRRPMSLYTPNTAPTVPSDDPMRRQSYRVLKSQPSEPMPPRFIERGSLGSANVFPPPLVMPSRVQEPVVFLTIDFELARVSNAFVDAIGAGTAQAIQGRKLAEIITPGEGDRVVGLQRSLQEEQGRKDPNYLPPIFGGRQEMERIIHSLPVDSEFVSKLTLDRQDFFTFVTAEGQPRPFPIRLGLVKEDSIYFVVLLLNPHQRPFQQQTPSPQVRDPMYSYQHQPLSQAAAPTGFEPNRPRLGDSRDIREAGFTPRHPAMPSPGTGVNPNISYLPASSSRVEHPGGATYQIPRSELPQGRPPGQPSFQLPPIRTEGHTRPSSDSRAGRVDIEGLIDRPHSGRG